MTSVVVKLRPDVADLARAPGPPDVHPALQVVAAAGHVLTADHPGIDDPSLRTWFRVTDLDAQEAESLAADLAGIDGVDAAYAEPDAGLPGDLSPP
jgi:hypothetical protein